MSSIEELKQELERLESGEIVRIPLQEIKSLFPAPIPKAVDEQAEFVEWCEQQKIYYSYFPGDEAFLFERL